MAGQKYKLVPKMQNNRMAIYIIIPPPVDEVRQVAYIEMPNDNQLSDNVDFVNDFITAYKKRLRKSL